MAYTKEDKEEIWTVQSLKRSIAKNMNKSKANANGAREANRKRFPNGYLYLIKLHGISYYKIGVSQSPRRRIMDIMNNVPFGLNILALEYFEDVYSLEHALHKDFKENKIKKEWFIFNEGELNEVLELIKECKNVCSTSR